MQMKVKVENILQEFLLTWCYFIMGSLFNFLTGFISETFVLFMMIVIGYLLNSKLK